MRVKGVLFRKCIGCNQVKQKANLIRICRTVDKEIEIDLTYKMEGRGAYICNDNFECLEKSIKFNKISRALKTEISFNKIEELQKKVRDIMI